MFLSKLFKKKEGGSFFGNLLRGVDKITTGGIVYRFVDPKKDPDDDDGGNWFTRLFN